VSFTRITFVVAFGFGCATAAGPGDGASGPGADPTCWPIVELQLQALEHGREWEPISTLNVDGTIANRRGTLGRLAADHFTIGTGPTPILEGRCRVREVEITSPLSPRFTMLARHTDDDALVELSGHRAHVRVGDDGLVDATLDGGRRIFGPPGGGGGVVRVIGDLRRARRTAALLVFVSAATGAGR
jgi:hypothetical protein